MKNAFGNFGPYVSETEIQNMRNLKEEKVKAEKELKELGEKFESLKEELQRDEVDLVNGIKDMCESINEKFCELMADMGYAGEDFQCGGIRMRNLRHNATKHFRIGGECDST